MGQFPDLLLEPLHRRQSKMSLRQPMDGEAEAQELPLPGTIHRTFLSIHLQPELAFQGLCHAGLYVPTHKLSNMLGTHEKKRPRFWNGITASLFRILRLLRSQELAARRATVRSCLACPFVDRGPRDFLVLWRTSLRRIHCRFRQHESGTVVFSAFSVNRDQETFLFASIAATCEESCRTHLDTDSRFRDTDLSIQILF